MKKKLKKTIVITMLAGLCLTQTACTKPQKLKNQAALALKVDDTSKINYIIADKGLVYSSTDVPIQYNSQRFRSFTVSSATGNDTTNRVYVNKTYFNVGDYVKSGDLLLQISTNGDSNKDSIADRVEKLKKDVEEYTYKKQYYTYLSDKELERKKLCKSYGVEFDSTNYTEYAAKATEYERKANEANLEAIELSAQESSRQIFNDMEGVIVYIARASRRNSYSANDVLCKIADDKLVISATTSMHDLFEVGSEYKCKFKVRVTTHTPTKDEDYTTYDTKDVECIVKCNSIDVLDEAANIASVNFDFIENNLDSTVASCTGVIEFINEQSNGEVVRVPNSCVINTQDGSLVFVLNDNNEREIRKVETGVVGSVYTEIKSGIEAGDKLIVNGVKESGN